MEPNKPRSRYYSSSMATSNSFSTGQFAALAVVVVVGSCIAGYYIAGGLQHGPDKSAVTQPSIPSTAAGPSTPAPPSTHETAQSDKPSGDYTAPNAPKIEISEEKAPPPAPAPPKAPPQTSSASADNDSEASQQDTTTANAPPDAGAVGTVPAPVTGNATAPASTAPTADPDYEQTTGSTDSEASQQATPVVDETHRPKFRVQVGTFSQAMSARSLADALRNRGYTTTTVSDQDGGKTVYHVQTGAFKARSTADRITLELQRQGFPAFVTTISQ